MENSVYINGVKTYAFKYQKNLLDFVAEKKIILIAINTEKILKEDLRLKWLNSSKTSCIIYGAWWKL